MRIPATFAATRQRAALTYPCYLAFETTRPELAAAASGWSIIVSVNTGYE